MFELQDKAGQIAGVLWDMDGVLLDSERVCHQAFLDVAANFPVQSDLSDLYLQTIGLTRAGIIARYTLELGSEAQAIELCDEVGRLYQQRSIVDLQLKPGVLEALNALMRHNIPQMVVTSSQTEVAKQKLQRFDLLPFFVDVLGGDLVEKGKPHPEPYLTGCRRLKLPQSHVLVVEDSENGVISGLSAGCMVLHVPDLIATKPEWQHDILGAIESLSEFSEWFEMQQGSFWV